MRKLVFITMMILSFSSVADARAKWGMAGCGVGAMIFEDKPGKIQILAATTNQYFVQSSSITSGTSNCEEMSGREEASLFITINKVALQKDISRGNGETLAGLAKILKCSNTHQLGSSLQKKYETIFPEIGGAGKSEAARLIEDTIQKDQALRKDCALYS